MQPMILARQYGDAAIGQPRCPQELGCYPVVLLAVFWGVRGGDQMSLLLATL